MTFYKHNVRTLNGLLSMDESGTKQCIYKNVAKRFSILNERHMSLSKNVITCLARIAKRQSNISCHIV